MCGKLRAMLLMWLQRLFQVGSGEAKPPQIIPLVIVVRRSCTTITRKRGCEGLRPSRSQRCDRLDNKAIALDTQSHFAYNETGYIRSFLLPNSEINYSIARLVVVYLCLYF